MLDDTSNTEPEVDTGIAEPDTKEVIHIKVTKGGTIAVDISKIHDRIYPHVLVHGLQKMVNRKTKPNADLKPDARAAQNLAAMYDGTYKVVGSKAESVKASGPVMVEARRLALIIVKAEIKAQGIKLVHVPKTELTKLANELLTDRPEIVAQAEASLKTAADSAEKAKVSGKLLKVTVDPKLVKAAEDAKAKKKATAKQTLSATQAGKVVAKAKPATK